jgi:hypothetical protein
MSSSKKRYLNVKVVVKRALAKLSGTRRSMFSFVFTCIDFKLPASGRGMAEGQVPGSQRAQEPGILWGRGGLPSVLSDGKVCLHLLSILVPAAGECDV